MKEWKDLTNEEKERILTKIKEIIKLTNPNYKGKG